MTSQTLNEACERMSLAELAEVVRLHCAITEAEALGQTHYAAGLRALLRGMVSQVLP